MGKPEVHVEGRRLAVKDQRIEARRMIESLGQDDQFVLIRCSPTRTEFLGTDNSPLSKYMQFCLERYIKTGGITV